MNTFKNLWFLILVVVLTSCSSNTASDASNNESSEETSKQTSTSSDSSLAVKVSSTATSQTTDQDTADTTMAGNDDQPSDIKTSIDEETKQSAELIQKELKSVTFEEAVCLVPLIELDEREGREEITPGQFFEVYGLCGALGRGLDVYVDYDDIDHSALNPKAVTCLDAEGRRTPPLTYVQFTSVIDSCITQGAVSRTEANSIIQSLGVGDTDW